MSSLNLLGFYRKNKKIELLESSSTHFFDSSMQVYSQAIVVPVNCYISDYKWSFSGYHQQIDGILKQALEKNIIFVTETEHHNSEFYVLMYPLLDQKSMSRTGYLLYRQNNQYFPFIYSIENNDYIVEIKGCGSPVGRFPNLHSRKQAGSFTKFHKRITGGLSFDDAQLEYNNLLKIDAQLNDFNIKPLATIKFNFLESEFGMLIRLVPSSIRASFTQNEAFDSLLNFSKKNVLRSMGKRMIQTLEEPLSLFHYNLSENNMVYVDTDSYELTDWSEGCSIHSLDTIQDFLLHVFPVFFLNDKYSNEDLMSYIAGIKDGAKCQYSNLLNNVSSLPQTFQEWLTLSQEILKVNFKTIYNRENISHYVENSIKPAFLQFGIKPQHGYDSQQLEEWVLNSFIPCFETKFELLSLFETIISKGLDDQFDLIYQYNEDALNKQVLKDVLAVDACYFSRKSHKDVVDTLNDSELKMVMPVKDIEDLYIYGLNKKDIGFYKDGVKTLLNEAKLFLEQSSLTLPSLDDIYSLRFSQVEFSLLNVLFPLYLQVVFYFEFQILCIESSCLNRGGGCKKELESLNDDLSKFKTRRDAFLLTPLTYQELLIQESDAFFNWLSLK